MIFILPLSIAIFFFLFGYITNKTTGHDEGFPFYVFSFYFLIATIICLERSQYVSAQINQFH